MVRPKDEGKFGNDKHCLIRKERLPVGTPLFVPANGLTLFPAFGDPTTEKAIVGITVFCAPLLTDLDQVTDFCGRTVVGVVVRIGAVSEGEEGCRCNSTSNGTC